MSVFQRLVTAVLLRMSSTDAKDEARWREARRSARTSRPDDNRPVRRSLGSY